MNAYFFVWLSSLNIALGSLAVLLIHRLTGGAWGVPLSAPLRAAAATLPVLALLMLPLWAALDSLFPWAGASRDPSVFEAHQGQWLRPLPFMLRSAAVFAVWIGIGAAALWPARGTPRESPLPAALGAIAFILATSLFAVDWVMSLIPENSTTMIGFLLMSGQVAAALALGALWAAARGRSGEAARGGLDLGNLLLAALMFHAYCLYMDYLIVWEANEPGEIAWYLRRSETLGVVYHWLLILVYLALPMALLLFRAVKRSPRGLAGVAALVLTGHLLMTYWYLAPLVAAGAGPGRFLLDWALALPLLMCWGAGVAVLARRMERQEAAA